MMCAIFSCALAVLFALGWPMYQRYRDAAFHRKVPDIKLPLNVRSGFLTVRHSAATLRDCEDSQGPLPDVSVRLAYKTTFDPATCDPAKHVLLVHGTGNLQDSYWWTADLLNAAGEEDLAALLSPQLKARSAVDRIQAVPGACVTTFDLRGHGLSEVPEAPWSTKLMAADIAAGMKLLHPGQKMHVNGLSLGFGVTLSLSFNYPDLVRTASGGGFLADRTSKDLAAWIFTRKLVLNALGLNMLGHMASVFIVCAPEGLLRGILRYFSLDAYHRASMSWLDYNESGKLSSLSRPVLWLAPVLDELAGYSLNKVRAEFDQIGTADKKLVAFNETGKEDHCHQMLDPDNYFTTHLMPFVIAHPE